MSGGGGARHRAGGETSGQNFFFALATTTAKRYGLRGRTRPSRSRTRRSDTSSGPGPTSKARMIRHPPAASGQSTSHRAGRSSRGGGQSATVLPPTATARRRCHVEPSSRPCAAPPRPGRPAVVVAVEVRVRTSCVGVETSPRAARNALGVWVWHAGSGEEQG